MPSSFKKLKHFSLRELHNSNIFCCQLQVKKDLSVVWQILTEKLEKEEASDVPDTQTEPTE